MCNTNTDVSADENESQETDSVIDDLPDLSLGYSDCTITEGKTLSSTFRASVVSEDEDSFPDDFIEVQYANRRYDQSAKPINLDVDQVAHRTVTTAETPRPLAKATNQATPKENLIRQPQQMFPRPTLKIQRNTGLNKGGVPDSFASEEFPILGDVSPQRPVDASGAVRDNFKPPDPSRTSIKPSLPSNLQGFGNRVNEEVEPKRKPKTGQFAEVSSQGTKGGTSSTGSVHSWSTKPGHPESLSIPVTLSQSFQSNVTGPKPRAEQQLEVGETRKIPEGVFVVCDHFLQENRGRSSSISIKIKTCRACENRNLLKYAAWNNVRGTWQEMRPYPASKIPPKVTFDVCRHFATKRPCPKEPCTFPHGKLETAMWIMERQGGGHDSQYDNLNTTTTILISALSKYIIGKRN